MPRNKLAPEPRNSLWSAALQYVGDVAPGGSLNPEWTPESVEAAKMGLGFTPVVGDVLSGYDALQALRQGNYGEAALSAVGMLPFVPGMTKVFHGGAKRISVPDLTKSGATSGIAEEGRAFWVTPSQESALGFGKLASETPAISAFGFTPKNPLTIEFPVKSILDGSFGQLKIDALNKARKAGHDAVIFKQAGKGEKLLEDEIAVLDPSVLKSLQR